MNASTPHALATAVPDAEGVFPSHAAPRPRTQDRAEIADWAERVVVQDLFAAAPAFLRARAGLFVERIGPVLGFGAPGIDSMLPNRIFVSPAEPGVAAEATALMVDAFAARGVARFLVHVPAALAAEELRQHLAARGVGPFRRAWVKLARGAEALPEVPSPFEIRAATADDGPVFAALVVHAFALPADLGPMLAAVVGRPRWHVFLARDAGVPVAAGALFAQGDVGYLGFGATCASRRGRGAQRAILAERIRVAIALGCRTVVAETGVRLGDEPNPSLDNMVALGMQPVAVRPNFAPLGATWR